MTDTQQKPDPESKRGRKANLPPGARPTDFYALPSQSKYVYVPTRRLWDRDAVVRSIGIDATKSLDRKRSCQELTWCPGMPMIVPDKVIFNGAWREKEGACTFNAYCPPDAIPDWADPDKAEPWLDLGSRLFGKYHDNVLDWMACRVQRPDIKINHCLVLGSRKHGIGKDTWLKGCQYAIGPWNWANVSARKAFNDAADKNSFLRSSILQINEVHDLGDKRFSFYDATKEWMAGPPDTLMVQDKWLVQHPIFNNVGPILTTNHLTDGLYIPPEDRRHLVLWSEILPESFPAGYWERIWAWYKTDGGQEHVAAYLTARDLVLFDPMAPPPKTEAWQAIVNANRDGGDDELRGVLADMADDELIFDGPRDDAGERELPEAILIDTVRRWCAGVANGELPGDADACHELHDFLGDKRQRRKLAHRFDKVGYRMVRNPDATGSDGMWRIGGKRCAVYARADLTGWAQSKAIADLIERERLVDRVAAARMRRERERLGKRATG